MISSQAVVNGNGHADDIGTGNGRYIQIVPFDITRACSRRRERTGGAGAVNERNGGGIRRINTPNDFPLWQLAAGRILGSRHLHGLQPRCRVDDDAPHDTGKYQ